MERILQKGAGGGAGGEGGNGRIIAIPGLSFIDYFNRMNSPLGSLVPSGLLFCE